MSKGSKLIAKTRKRMSTYTDEERAVLHEKSVFILGLLDLMGEHDMDHYLNYRTDEQWAPLTVFMNCNDVFYWACADAVEVTPENIDMLEQSFKDVVKVLPDDASEYDKFNAIKTAPTLFCSMVLEMRPQGAMYSAFPEFTWQLFDACGPKRKTDVGNPYKQGKYKGSGSGTTYMSPGARALGTMIYCADTQETEPLETALERMDSNWIEENDCLQMSYDLIDALKQLLPREPAEPRLEVVEDNE